MADPSRYADSKSDSGDVAPGPPRWVKVFGTIAIILVVLFVILHLTGGGLGGHRP
jgi:hypothetical protein